MGRARGRPGRARRPGVGVAAGRRGLSQGLRSVVVGMVGVELPLRLMVALLPVRRARRRVVRWDRGRLGVLLLLRLLLLRLLVLWARCEGNRFGLHWTGNKSLGYRAGRFDLGKLWF